MDKKNIFDVLRKFANTHIDQEEKKDHPIHVTHRHITYFDYDLDETDPRELAVFMDLYAVGHSNNECQGFIHLLQMIGRLFPQFLPKSIWYLSSVGLEPSVFRIRLDLVGLDNMDWNGIVFKPDLIKWLSIVPTMDPIYLLTIIGGLLKAVQTQGQQAQQSSFAQIAHMYVKGFSLNLGLDVANMDQLWSFLLNDESKLNNACKLLISGLDLTGFLFDLMWQEAANDTPLGRLCSLIVNSG